MAAKSTPPEEGVGLVLEHLKESRAFDFTGYKRGTLTRRIDKRMQEVGVESYAEYVDYLEVHPDEFEPLFNTILINVTSFFRDPEAWDAVRAQVIPDLKLRKPDGEIRVWSAACASGQEAYTAVMVLAEEFGADFVREHVKVYATDLDEEALDQARQATYTERELESVPTELIDKYFVEAGGRRQVNSDLRRVVIFGRHDLLQDAPISKVDLVLCRNTLMYFNADVQNLLIHRLHFSVADGGYLLLGKVEMLLGKGELFEPVDMKQRLFRKITRATLRHRLLAMAGRGLPVAYLGTDRVIDHAFETQPRAEVILDESDMVVAANAEARTSFGIPADAIGGPFQDLEVSYRPVELRSSIDQARAGGRKVTLAGVARWNPAGELSFLDIDVVPLEVDGQRAGVVITFNDVSRHHTLQEELEQTHRELETAYEELQSSNEELETTNEELQSTIEELETTNEELQSTNEELETMNEELSSTNEELQAINDELRDRTTQLNDVTAYMESVLTSLDASVVVVDTDLRIRVWNGHSYEMWGLRAEDAEGEQLLTLDIGFPVGELAKSLRACLAGEDVEPVEAMARNRRGVQMQCRARVAPLRDVRGATDGAIVIITEVP